VLSLFYVSIYVGHGIQLVNIENVRLKMGFFPTVSIRLESEA